MIPAGYAPRGPGGGISARLATCLRKEPLLPGGVVSDRDRWFEDPFALLVCEEAADCLVGGLG
jgi:hypothetical protein